MPDVSSIPAGGSPGPSDRVRLARVARAATLGVAGVVTTDSGPGGLYVTASGTERLDGIVCVAAHDGGYDIAVRLVAGLVPLPDLSERISAAIARAAATVGVPCSSITVHFSAIEPGDL